MKKFKVTMLIPQERVIESPDLQSAHNEVSKMLNHGVETDNHPRPILHSIIEVTEQPEINFGPSPAA